MIERVLDISTAHVPKGTHARNFKCRTVAFRYGWIVWVTPDLEDLPDWFKPIHDYAVEKKCLLISFDCDSTHVGPWKTYD